MKSGTIVAVAALLAAAFVAGIRCGHHFADVGKMIETRIDTVYISRPAATALTRRPASVVVPRWLFAPVVAECATTADLPEIPAGSTDSVVRDFRTTDSVRMAVEVETRTYADSTFRAQVSGPAVGALGPALDWIEVYGRTRTEYTVAAPRWEVGPAVGAWAAIPGGGVWIGAAARRNVGRLSLSGAAGYDTHNGGGFASVQASVALWRK